MQAENLQREQIWQTKSDNLQLSYNEVQAGLQNEINNLQHKIVLIEQKNYEQKLENAHQFYVTKDWQDLAINIKNENDVLLKSKFWKFTAPFRLFSMTSSKLNELSYAIHNYSLKQSTPSTDSDLILNQDEFTNLSDSDSNNTPKLTLNSRETMNNIQDLLALYGENFLNESYRIILGRKADPQGLKHYLSMLNIGTSKLEMLLQLSRSKEAKKYNANFPGLENALSRHKLSKLPFFFWRAPKHEQIDYKLRMLENKLYELANKKTSYSPSVTIESNQDAQNQINYLNQVIAERDNELSLIKNNNTLDLTWEQFEAQVLAFRDDFKGIFVQELVIDWNVPLYQRPQHIASAFGRLGYLVIYKTANWGLGDNINGVRQVAPNVWMTSCWDVNSIPNAVHSIYSTAYHHQPHNIPNYVKDGVIIYEYIDHIDPQISGEGETIEKLLKLQEWAFTGGVDFVVASAKKLHAEAVNSVGAHKVILAQNGVDTRHYRKSIHDSTALPDNLMAFRNKYQNIVGYFGAIAPWLWYKAIDGLVKSRPDLGFIFIGPDYFNGVDKLPVAENVLYLGVVDYKILPAYAKQFDVCFIPFEPGEIAKTTSPLKLFEYFALEKPVVVTSEMAECVAFPEVFSGSSVATLSKAIDKAIAIKGDSSFKKRLAQLADENDWDERAKAMESVFSKALSDQALNRAAPLDNAKSVKLTEQVSNTAISIDNIKPVTLYEDIEKRFGVTQEFAKLYLSKQNYSALEFDTWDSLSKKLNSLQNMYINFALSTFNRGLSIANMLEKDRLINHKNRYLDVGTGYGGFPRAFSSVGFKEVIGIELQQHLADYAKANTIDIDGATILNWDFEQSDTSQLEKFDLITCNDVIEHVKNPALTIEKMLGLLNKNGCISMEIPNDNCILYVKSDGHFQLFGITQLSREDAADYYAEMLNIDRGGYLFEMGESHELDWYFNKLTKNGGKVKVFDKHKIGELDQVPALINELKVTFEEWRNSNKQKLTANTFHKMEIAITNYINMIQKDYKAIKSKSSKENFIKKYLYAFWTLALSK